MVKTIQVSEKTWKKLSLKKIKTNASSIDEVISYLLEIDEQAEPVTKTDSITGLGEVTKNAPAVSE